MFQRVLMRADASRTTGYGHLIRTIALAGYLREDFDCVIASYNSDSGSLSEYQRSEITTQATPLEITAADIAVFDALFLDAVRPDDIVVLDNYYFSTEYQQAVRSRCRALVCIDDMHCRHFVADVVMTFCPLTREDFSLEPYTRFYGGIDRAFLRTPFLAPCTRPENRRRESTPHTLLVAIGGADPFHLTDKILDILLKYDTVSRIDVLAGDTVDIKHPEDDRMKIHRRAKAGEVALLLDNADLAVIPASTICAEAFSRHTPVALGYYVDNQHELYDYLAASGYVAPIGCLLDDSETIAKRLAPILAGEVTITAAPYDFLKRRRETIDIFKSL